MTTNYNQQRNSPSLSLTATGHGTPYYALGRSPPKVQQRHQQQQQQQKQQQQRHGIQQMPMFLHAPMMNQHQMTMRQQHLQQEPTFLISPTPSSQPSSATAENVYNDPDSQAYCDYLYQFGFLKGDFSDITVSIPSIAQIFDLHSLIISRSPYLHQRLIRLQHQRHQHHNNARLVFELDYGQVMVESFRAALMHLYRPLSRQDMVRMANENPRLCLELIGIAEYLGLAMLKDGLIHVVLSQDFGQSSAIQWIHLLHSLSSSSQKQLWIHALENRLLLYLARDLPAQLVAFPATSIKVNMDVTIGKHLTRGYMPSKTTSLPGMTDLAKLYSTLPWTYLTQCLEHPDLPVQDTLQRYLFAQKIFQLRSSSSTTTELEHKHITLGLRFSNNGNQQHQPDTSTHYPSNNNAVMGLYFSKTTPRKLGKWDPSLYGHELVEGDDEDL